jgi:ABC-type transporter Mla MlaB component
MNRAFEAVPDGGFKIESMTLRIQRSAKGEVMVFTLSGRIAAEEVAELQRLFEAEGQDLRIVLDLNGVQLVDQAAVRFLARCEANGIQLENCPGYIREWIVREGS